MNTKNQATLRMVESGILIAVGTMLSFLTFQSPWAFGGGVTLASMLPLVILSHRHGTRWGLFCAFVYAVLQMIIGFANVRYGNTLWMMLGIAMLDYIVAYTVVGLSAVFRGKVKNEVLAIALGVVFALSLRFLCHFVSGWAIWGVLWPNDKGLAAWLYSLIYNGGYMVPEIIITAGAAVLSYLPMKKYWQRQAAVR